MKMLDVSYAQVHDLQASIPIPFQKKYTCHSKIKTKLAESFGFCYSKIPSTWVTPTLRCSCGLTPLVEIFNVRWQYWRSVSSNWWLNPALWLLNCGSWIRVCSSSNPSSYLPSFQRDLTTFLLSHYSQKHFWHFLPWYHQATSRWSQQKILCNYWFLKQKFPVTTSTNLTFDHHHVFF